MLGRYSSDLKIWYEAYTLFGLINWEILKNKLH